MALNRLDFETETYNEYKQNVCDKHQKRYRPLTLENKKIKKQRVKYEKHTNTYNRNQNKKIYTKSHKRKQDKQEPQEHENFKMVEEEEKTSDTKAEKTSETKEEKRPETKEEKTNDCFQSNPIGIQTNPHFFNQQFKSGYPYFNQPLQTQFVQQPYVQSPFIQQSVQSPFIQQPVQSPFIQQPQMFWPQQPYFVVQSKK